MARSDIIDLLISHVKSTKEQKLDIFISVWHCNCYSCVQYQGPCSKESANILIELTIITPKPQIS
jgi:hypothetical protein